MPTGLHGPFFHELTVIDFTFFFNLVHSKTVVQTLEGGVAPAHAIVQLVVKVKNKHKLLSIYFNSENYIFTNV